ncbi:hypothetical protein [Amycolatopsis pigmentata]|uniref:PPE family protein n=1 Tax=Amycolatopsis pigmentata TaxID=450801 RepID=A0ABW5FN00_9PSEU
MGMFDWIGDAAKAVVHGVENAADWVGDRVSDVEHWFGDLFTGDLGTQAMSVPEVVQKVKASQGATDWHGSAGVATDLAGDHRAVATQIQNISSGLESVWTGSGADAAQAKLKPLRDVADSAAQTFTANSTHVTGIASGFDEMKRSLTPIPSSPPHKNLWDVVTPWSTDTEDQINQYNAQIQENLNRYNAYSHQAQDAGHQLTVDYGQIGTFDGNVTLAAQSTTGTTNHPAPGSGSNDHALSRLDAPSPTVHPTGGPATPSAAGPGVISGHGRLPETDSTTSSASFPAGPAPTGPGTSGYGIPGPNGPAPTADGLAVLGGPGIGTAGGLGGPDSGSGRGGNAGRGALETGQPGAGNRTGAAPRTAPGAITAAEKATVMGRGNTTGMGTAGAGAGRGKDDEDKEHNRKYGLEDDSLFADHSDGLIDPETGMRVTPPTIGG